MPRELDKLVPSAARAIDRNPKKAPISVRVFVSYAHDDERPLVHDSQLEDLDHIGTVNPLRGLAFPKEALVLVGPDVNPRDPGQVMQAIRRNFDAEEDFHLIARTAADTLDFTGEATHKGSKMILDATAGPSGEGASNAVALPANIGKIAPGIVKHRLVGKTMLDVQTAGEGRGVVQKMVDNPLLGSVKIVTA